MFSTNNCYTHSMKGREMGATPVFCLVQVAKIARMSVGCMGVQMACSGCFRRSSQFPVEMGHQSCWRVQQEPEGLSQARGDATVRRARALQPTCLPPAPAWLGQLRASCLGVSQPRLLKTEIRRSVCVSAVHRAACASFPCLGVTQPLCPVVSQTPFPILLEFQGFHVILLDPLTHTRKA